MKVILFIYTYVTPHVPERGADVVRNRYSTAADCPFPRLPSRRAMYSESPFSTLSFKTKFMLFNPRLESVSFSNSWTPVRFSSSNFHVCVASCFSEPLQFVHFPRNVTLSCGFIFSLQFGQLNLRPLGIKRLLIYVCHSL